LTGSSSAITNPATDLKFSGAQGSGPQNFALIDHSVSDNSTQNRGGMAFKDLANASHISQTHHQLMESTSSLQPMSGLNSVNGPSYGNQS
jgi:hypothetical protein